MTDEQGRKQFEQEYANTAKWKQFVAPDNKHIYGSWYESGWQAGRASLEEENRELRDLLWQAYKFIPFRWAGRKKYEAVMMAGKSGEVGNGTSSRS